MTTDTLVRQPKGIPVGGQFATHDRTEADVALTAVPSPAADAESPFRRRYDTPEEKIKAFMAELETAVADLRTDEDWLRYLDVMSRFHTYSMNNQLLIALQRPDATRVAGFKKWQELGRQVRKGEKGIAIMAPRKAKVNVVDGAGKPVIGDNGKPLTEYRVVGVTTATVFDVSQTDGPPLPTTSAMKVTADVTPELIADLERAVEDAGFTLVYEDMPGNKGGYTTADGSKKVAVAAGMQPADVARTLAHELGHIHAGHLDRSGEYHSGIGGCRGEMEVEADSISYAVLRANGVDGSIVRSNAEYIEGWSRRQGDPNAVKNAANTVAKSVKAILGGTKFRGLTG